MALRFQKRIRIAPGIRLNISKTGISGTVGVRGASVNLGKNGAFINAGLPGSGLSTRTRLDGAARDETPAPTAGAGVITTFLTGLGAVAVIGLALWIIAKLLF